jgi:hypothetical protein
MSRWLRENTPRGVLDKDPWDRRLILCHFSGVKSYSRSQVL